MYKLCKRTLGIRSFLAKCCPNLFFAGLVLLASCGYRFGRGEFVEKYATLSIPYAEGDFQGILTNEMIRHAVSSGALKYSRSDGELILKVCLFDPEEDNIGFAYSQEDDGSYKKVIAANEARIRMTARISVMEASSNHIVIGPVNITSTITYDFESDYRRFDFHEFSLGQLETHNIAQDAAYYPLYRQLAQKIVDYVNHSW